MVGLKWGYIDRTGTLVIPAIYDDADEFHEGRGRVTINGLSGFVDDSGRLVVPARYASAWWFVDGLASVERGDRWGFIDSQGAEVVAPVYQSLGIFSEGFAAAEDHDRWGFIDRSGKWVIDPKFVSVGRFSEGRVAATFDKRRWGYVDRTGAWAIAPAFWDAGRFHGGWALVSRNKRSMFIDRNGRVGPGPNAGRIESFQEGLAPAVRDGKWGFIDRTGVWVIPPRFVGVRDFSEERAWVSVAKDQWGVIDRTGRWIAAPRFSWWPIMTFRGGLAQARLGFANLAYIDREGRFIWFGGVTRPYRPLLVWWAWCAAFGTAVLVSTLHTRLAWRANRLDNLNAFRRVRLAVVGACVAWGAGAVVLFMEVARGDKNAWFQSATGYGRWLGIHLGRLDGPWVDLIAILSGLPYSPFMLMALLVGAGAISRSILQQMVPAHRVRIVPPGLSWVGAMMVGFMVTTALIQVAPNPVWRFVGWALAATFVVVLGVLAYHWRRVFGLTRFPEPHRRAVEAAVARCGGRVRIGALRAPMAWVPYFDGLQILPSGWGPVWIWLGPAIETCDTPDEIAALIEDRLRGSKDSARTSPAILARALIKRYQFGKILPPWRDLEDERGLPTRLKRRIESLRAAA